MNRQQIQTKPTLAQLHEALRHGYRFARQGNYGLALIDGDLWVTCGTPPHGAPLPPDPVDELASVAQAWQAAAAGALNGPASPAPSSVIHEARLRSMILQGSSWPGSKAA